MDWKVCYVFLYRLTAEGKTIIASVHQPNWSIYKLFDSVTILCNGRAIYHGPAGDSPLNYFCELGKIHSILFEIQRNFTQRFVVSIHFNYESLTGFDKGELTFWS